MVFLPLSVFTYLLLSFYIEADMKNMFFWAVVAYVITLTVAFSVKQLFVPRPITVPLINIYEHPEFDPYPHTHNWMLAQSLLD